MKLTTEREGYVAFTQTPEGVTDLGKVDAEEIFEALTKAQVQWPGLVTGVRRGNVSMASWKEAREFALKSAMEKAKVAQENYKKQDKEYLDDPESIGEDGEQSYLRAVGTDRD